MKIVFKDFDFWGEHIEEFTCEFPQVKDIEDLDVDKLIEYVCNELGDFVNFQNSFKVEAH